MDIASAFSFVFHDRHWIGKCIIGGFMVLFSFLIVPLFIAFGYGVEVIRHSTSKAEPSLPDWSGLGTKLRDGILSAVILIAYQLPLLGLYLLFLIVTTALNAFGEMGRLIASAISIMSFLLYIFYWIAYFFIIPVALLKFATGDFSQSFDFDSILDYIKNNYTQMLIVVLMTYVALVIGSLGYVAFIIGAAFTYFYALLVIGNLFGQLGIKSVGGEMVRV